MWFGEVASSSLLLLSPIPHKDQLLNFCAVCVCSGVGGGGSS